MILAKKARNVKFFKGKLFFEKLTSRAELFEPKSEPSQKRAEPRLGGNTIINPVWSNVSSFALSFDFSSAYCALPSVKFGDHLWTIH